MRTPIAAKSFILDTPPNGCPRCQTAHKEASEWEQAFMSLYRSCMASADSQTSVVRVEIVVNNRIMNRLEAES